MLRHALINRAASVAISAHAGQKRRFADVDYITHPARLAAFVESMPGVDHVDVAAAWLHDSVGVGVATPDRLEADLRAGRADVADDDVADDDVDAVIDLVAELTAPAQKAGVDRAEYKAAEFVRLSKVSRRAKRLKLADRLDNVNDALDRLGDDEKAVPAAWRAEYFAETVALLKAVGDADPPLAAVVADRLVGLTPAASATPATAYRCSACATIWTMAGRPKVRVSCPSCGQSLPVLPSGQAIVAGG